MSFRIEDILKSEPRPKSHNILQPTLLSRENLQYCRSMSDPNAAQNSTWAGDNYYLNLNYYSFYRTKALSFPNLCNRPLWPNHTPLAFFPQFHFSKRKGGQVRFTAIQTDALEKRFASNKYLCPEERKFLADSLKLTDRQVKTWFQNRRAKWRRSNSVSSTEITSSKGAEPSRDSTEPTKL